MRKLIITAFTLLFAISVVDAQSIYGVKKLKKLNQIGLSGNTDSLPTS
jgi:hypothetical protein